MMMHELPLIVTDIGELSQMVEHAKNGFKIPVIISNGNTQIDIDVMSEKIDVLLKNKKMSRSFGRRGRLIFKKKYEINLFKEKIIELYLSI